MTDVGIPMHARPFHERLKSSLLRHAGPALILAAAYYAAARLGLHLQFAQSQATPVWPPSGIALAAAILGGTWTAAGVFIGAFCANLADFYVKAGGSEVINLAALYAHLSTNPDQLAMSAIIAVGNSLEAIIGLHLIRRFCANADPFVDISGVLTFCVSCLIACTISSTVGSSTLVAGGVLPLTMFQAVWLTWWIGDVTGILILTPALVAWSTLLRARFEVRPLLANVTALAVLFLFNQMAFEGWFNIHVMQRAVYLLFPILLLIAFRFGAATATAGIVITSASAVIATVGGAGPFARADQNEALILLQGFVSVVSMTVLFIVATLRERGRALAASTEALDQFRVLFESVPNGVLAVDRLGSIVLVNKQIEEQFGYRRVELIGQPVEMLMPEGICDAHAELRRSFMFAPEARPMGAGRDLLGQRKDGSQFPIEIGLNPARTRDGDLVMATVIDISARKSAEKQLSAASEALQVADEHRQLAVEAAELGIWTWDPVKDEMWWSDQLRKIIGVPETMAASRHSWYERIHPADRHLVADSERRRLAGQQYYEYEYRIVRLNDQATRWINSKGRVEFDKTGRAIRMCSVAQDVTARKAMEQAQHDLRHRLMQAQEGERLRLAHELHDQAGQSLAAALMDLKRLESAGSGSVGKPFQQLRAQLEQMGQALHRIALELRPASIDELGLSSVLATYISEWGSQFNIATDFQCVDDKIDEVADDIRTTLYRVTQEALTNIGKHAKEANTVSVVIERVAGELRLMIEDNGCGFDPLDADAKADRRVGGLGLVGMNERLALVGGTLEIESSTGLGTTIFARVPVELKRTAA